MRQFYLLLGPGWDQNWIIKLLFFSYLDNVYNSIDDVICGPKFINWKASCLKQSWSVSINTQFTIVSYTKFNQCTWWYFNTKRKKNTWWYISAQNKTSRVYVEKNRRLGRSKSTISSACTRIIF